MIHPGISKVVLSLSLRLQVGAGTDLTAARTAEEDSMAR